MRMILPVLMITLASPTLAQNADLSGATPHGAFDVVDGLAASDYVFAPAPSADQVSRNAALAAASEPDAGGPLDALGLDVSGQLVVGVNSRSGAFGEATVTVGARDIGDTGIDAWVSLRRGFDL